jgi:hypothetical protein
MAVIFHKQNQLLNATLFRLIARDNDIKTVRIVLQHSFVAIEEVELRTATKIIAGA